MTRQEEIALASKQHKKDFFLSANHGDEFIEGAEWPDSHPINVWHDASEEPKIGEQVLAIDYDGMTGSGTFNIKLTTGIFIYDTLILDWDSVVRWA